MQWTIDLVVDRGLSVLGSFPEARDRQLGIGSNRRNVGRCMDGHHRMLGMTITLSDASEVVTRCQYWKVWVDALSIHLERATHKGERQGMRRV